MEYAEFASMAGDNNLDIAREVGKLQGIADAHAARMDRAELAHGQEIREIKIRLENQDGKLDRLMALANEATGARDAQAMWLKIIALMIPIVGGIFAAAQYYFPQGGF